MEENINTAYFSIVASLFFISLILELPWKQSLDIPNKLEDSCHMCKSGPKLQS